MSQYVLSATLEMRDKMTAAIKTAKKNVSGFKTSVVGSLSAVDRLTTANGRLAASAVKSAAEIKKTASALSGIKGNHRAAVSVTDKATPAITRIRNQMNSIRSKEVAINLVQKGGKLKNSLDGLASGMLMNTSLQMLGGAGVGFGIYNTVKSYMDFEQTMSGVKAISGATDEEFQKLTASALEMGAKTKFTTTEAAQALTYMGMAGWKTEEMIGGLPGIMNLAAASGEDLASVSDIVTDAMTSFKMGADEAGEFADVLAAAAANSNTNVGKMGYTFKYVAPLAGALGYNIQDTALAIGAMADSGVKGEQAGTSLRSLMTRLVSPTKDVKEAMATLSQHIDGGFSAIDTTTGKMKPLRKILLDLRKGFKGLDEATQGKVASDLAGQEAMSGLLAIVNESDDKFERLTKAIDGSRGAADKMAKTRLDNLAGDLTYLSSAWDGLTKNLLSGHVSSGLRDLAQEGTKLLNRFNENIKDGLDFGDVFDIVGTLVVDLKNKFLQLDGVGSVLAGGALAGALYKIAKLTKNGVDAVSSVLHPKTGGIAGGRNGALNDMVVSANTVIVNGTVSSGGTGIGGAGSIPGTKADGKIDAGKAARYGKIFGRVMMGAALATSAYEVYRAAPEERGAAALKAGGSLAGMYAGSKAGALAGGAIGGAFGGIGAVPGALIGSIIGGLGGSVFGNYIGNGLANGTFGAGRLQSMREATMYRDNASRGMTYEDYDDITKTMEQATEERSKVIGDLWNNVWDGLKAHGQEAVESIKGQWSDVAGWYDASVWDPIDASAGTTGADIGSAFTDAWSTVQGAWSGAAAWFEANVMAPISSKVSQISASAMSHYSFGSDGSVRVDDSVPMDAVGDMHFSGGLAQINEHGGELIDLPQGSRIYPAEKTAQIISREVQNSTASGNSVMVTGNTFVVRNEADMDKIAYTIMRALEQGYANYGGA